MDKIKIIEYFKSKKFFSAKGGAGLGLRKNFQRDWVAFLIFFVVFNMAMALYGYFVFRRAASADLIEVGVQDGAESIDVNLLKEGLEDIKKKNECVGNLNAEKIKIVDPSL